jgi:cyanophycinase-like exopeptidase
LSFSQSYTSFFTGSTTDVETNPLGGVCLMGGASENDEAMKWFLNRASGGDILVLRASGSDGYNDYLYTDLGIAVNSVETIRFNDGSANTDPYVLDKIKKAEAIWFAGGDQWNYINYWRNSAVDSLINEAISDRNIVIGGTSAGMAILGSHYFSAENNTVTSATALQNPYNNNVTADNTPFLQVPFLNNVITDTHYDNPDRRGRHSVFLARILTDTGIQARGIACDEYTAVCIDENGLARVYGGYPQYDENAYFIQINCELNDPNPEICEPNTPLTWNHAGKALKVYAVHGTSTGENTFDLNDWQTGTGGRWEHWSVVDGAFSDSEGIAIDCGTVSIMNQQTNETAIYPNPFVDVVNVENENLTIQDIHLLQIDGRELKIENLDLNSTQIKLNLEEIPSGCFWIEIQHLNGSIISKIVVKK